MQKKTDVLPDVCCFTGDYHDLRSQKPRDLCLKKVDPLSDGSNRRYVSLAVPGM